MPTGAINNTRDLLALWFGDEVKTRRLESDFTVGLAITKIAIANPQRTVMIITNAGANAIAISGNPAVTATTGILIAPGASTGLLFIQDLDMMIDDWYAISGVAGNAVHVYERLIIGEL